MAIEQLFLIHHSHTDWGYTHHPKTARRLHWRFLDRVLEIIDEDAAPDAADDAFRWNCESLAVVEDWANHRPAASVDALISAAARGRIELTALWCNMTPLFEVEQIYRLSELVTQWRRRGARICMGMNSDVNGLPWSLVDLFAELDLIGVSMATNEYFGKSPFAQPFAFRWVSPGGRSILAYNGNMYNEVSHHGVPNDLERAARQLPGYLKAIEAAGYQHNIIALQITYPDYPDNGPPNPVIGHFVREWNRRGLSPRMRVGTFGEFMNQLQRRQDALPSFRGDWNDTWSFGFGAQALEVAVNRASHDRLTRVETLRLAAMDDPRRLHQGQEQISQSLELISRFDEHTFGADQASAEPDAPRTIGEWIHKADYAHTGSALTLMAERDGLLQLAQQVRHNGAAGILAYNPCPYPVTTALQALAHWIDPPAPMDLSHHHAPRGFGHKGRRQAIYTQPVRLEGWGYRWLPAEQWSAVCPAPANLTATPTTLESDGLRIELDEQTGGLKSLYDKHRNVELADPAEYPLAACVVESADSEKGRHVFFEHDWKDPFCSDAEWHTDWPAVREAGRCLGPGTVETSPLGVAIQQHVAHPALNGLVLRYAMRMDSAMLELTAEFDLPNDHRPRGIYLTFPLAMKEAVCRYDGPGTTIQFDEDLLPGACRDFVSVGRWIDLSSPSHGLTVVTPDVPLWMIGGFHFGRMIEHPPHRPLLLAWPFNNYWDTNFRLSQPGRVTLRFWLYAHGPFDEAETIQQTQAVIHKPLLIPTTGQASGSWPQQGQLFEFEGAGVVPLSLRPLSGDQVLVRLQNTTGTARRVRLGSRRLIIRAAHETDPAGQPHRPLPFEAHQLTCTIAPRSIKTLVLRVDTAKSSQCA